MQYAAPPPSLRLVIAQHHAALGRALRRWLGIHYASVELVTDLDAVLPALVGAGPCDLLVGVRFGEEARLTERAVAAWRAAARVRRVVVHSSEPIGSWPGVDAFVDKGEDPTAVLTALAPPRAASVAA